MLNFENLDKFQYQGVGLYDIPRIAPEFEEPLGDFIPMNYVKTCRDPADKIVHCFVDDYQFARYWNRPDVYIEQLRKFKAVCAPDFSTYTDMPVAMQIYNHYRKHWLAAYWQMRGITVYPTISWSDKSSYEWCFDGEPVGGVVAVSSVGTQNNVDSKRLFLQGYEEMMKRLDPKWVIFYGQVPVECDWNVIRVQPHYDSIMAINVYAKGSNVRLSKNFTLREFQCQCSYSSCTVVKVDSALVDILQNMRDHYGKALHVCPKHSGYRCGPWNTKQGGAEGSYHTKGMAADISVDGVAPAELARYAESIGVKGIGLYDWGIHVDTRTSKFYWKTDKQIPCSTFGGALAAPAAPGTSGTGEEYTLQQFVLEVQQALGTTATGEALLARTITVCSWKNRKHAVVAPIQRRLNDLGYACGDADGKAGPKFTNAVKQLQAEHRADGCVKDGVITAKRATWRVLLGMV